LRGTDVTRGVAGVECVAEAGGAAFAEFGSEAATDEIGVGDADFVSGGGEGHAERQGEAGLAVTRGGAGDHVDGGDTGGVRQLDHVAEVMDRERGRAGLLAEAVTGDFGEDADDGGAFGEVLEFIDVTNLAIDEARETDEADTCAESGGGAHDGEDLAAVARGGEGDLGALGDLHAAGEVGGGFGADLFEFEPRVIKELAGLLELRANGGGGEELAAEFRDFLAGTGAGGGEAISELAEIGGGDGCRGIGREHSGGKTSDGEERFDAAFDAGAREADFLIGGADSRVVAAVLRRERRAVAGGLEFLGE